MLSTAFGANERLVASSPVAVGILGKATRKARRSGFIGTVGTVGFQRSVRGAKKMLLNFLA